MIRFGVTRATLSFPIEEAGPIQVLNSVEDVDAWIDDDGPGDGTVTLYTIDLPRLREILQQASSGEPIDAILLALDAAALGNSHTFLDGDGPTA